MLKYVLKRLLLSIPVIIGVSVLVFSLVHLLPGDPVVALFGKQQNPELVEVLRHEYGLDKPLYVQYLNWMSQILRGNLGQSIRFGVPVAELIRARIPATATLVASSMVVALVISLPLGIVAAVKRNSRVDYFAVSLALFGSAVPFFWVAVLLILVFCLYLGWFPSAGFVPIWENPIDSIYHTILPSIPLALLMTGSFTRMTRASMIEALRLDCIKFARSKGLTRNKVIYTHALRNALLPLVTIVGMNIGYLLGGSILVENVFGWPGIGDLIVWAIYQRDYPVVQGVILLYAIVFYSINLITDLLYSVIDPRIRYD